MKYSRIVTEFYGRAWAIREETLTAMHALIHEHAFELLKLSQDEIRERIDASNAANGYVPHDRGEARFVATGDRFPPGGLVAMEAGGKRNSAPSGSVAVIPITGIISHRMNMMGSISGPGGTSTQKLTGQFRQALEDGNCKAIVFDVDSPGGSVEGVTELASEIYNARRQKPITAVSNSMACSAAYWIGSAAETFVVTPSGQCGSIGVFMLLEEESEALAKMGIKVNLIKAGKYKAEGHPSQPLSDEARAFLQSQCEAVYSMFVKAVAQNRKTSQAAVRDGYGQGRSLLASDAVKAGLADRVATLDDVLAEHGVKGSSPRSALSAPASPESRAGSEHDVQDAAAAKPEPFKDQVCAECGVAATNGATDFRELPPKNGFACWEPVCVHYGCDLHNAVSKKVRLSGAIEYEAAKPADDDEDDSGCGCNGGNPCAACQGCTQGGAKADDGMSCSCDCSACQGCDYKGGSKSKDSKVSDAAAARRRQLQLL